MIRFSLMMFFNQFDQRETACYTWHGTRLSPPVQPIQFFILSLVYRFAYRAAIIGPDAFSCAWVHLSRRLDCARLIPQHDCQRGKILGAAPSTGAMLRKNSGYQIKAMAKSKSMNTPLTAIAVAECERSEEGEFDHRPCVGASQPSESTATLPDFANAAMPRR
jgi:hypothetical protein